MAPPALKSARSTANSRVSLISQATPSSDFTSLRRSTRSTTRVKSEEAEAAPGLSTLNLSSYAYNSPPRKRIKTEVKEEEDPLVKIEPDEKPRLPRAASTARAKAEKKGQGQPTAARIKAHPEPPKWREQYALIEKMRAGIEAPVDTMGCERPLTMHGLDDKTLRFHILISLMLSSQTKDAVTSQAVVNLHQALPGGLTAESLAGAPSDTVAEAINKVGFWRRKTEYIQDAARTLLKQPGEARGDVPQTIEELCQLKGVGPKMGFLALQAGWNINAGIGVDVHVHRISNRLKWHKPPTKSPEETRVNLESWLPLEYHRPINPLLVGFGQVICLPVGPRCDLCLLGQQKLCPSRVAVNAANRKEVTFTFTADSGPKVEIAYEEEVKVESGVVAAVKTEVDMQVKEELVDVQVKEEPLDMQVKEEPGA